MRYRIVRKATGRIVDKVPEDLLRDVLANIPAGVYELQDAAGRELNIVTVRNNCIRYRDHNGLRPVVPVSTCRALVPVGTAW